MGLMQVSDYIKEHVSDNDLLAFRQKISHWDNDSYGNTRYSFYEVDILRTLHQEVKDEN